MTEASIAPATRRAPPAPRLGAPRLRHTRLAALAPGTQPKALTAVDGAEADFAIDLAIAQGRSYVEQAKVPLPDRMQMYNLLLRLNPHQVFTPDFLAQVDQADPLRQQRAVWQQVSGDASALNLMLAYDWRYTLAEADLPKVRGSTQLAGVAVGYPFLDQTLLDFSLALPSEYKLKGQKLRWFFKEALRGFLPDEILAKKKQGLGLPFGVWATKHAGLQQLAADSLHSLAGRGIVQPAFIETLLNELLPAHPGYYGEMVWILMMLEEWMRRPSR